MHDHDHEQTTSGSLRPKAARLEEPESDVRRPGGAVRAAGTPPGPPGSSACSAPPGTAASPPVLARRIVSPVHDVDLLGRSALDPDVRTDMEARLGHDFGDVRVHDDAAAARLGAARSTRTPTRSGPTSSFQRDRYDPQPPRAGPRWPTS